MAVPWTAFFLVMQVVRNRELFRDSSAYEAESAGGPRRPGAADVERAQGVGRRVPTLLSLLVIPLLVGANAFVTVFFMVPALPVVTTVVIALSLGVFADVADLWLHRRNVPHPVAIDAPLAGQPTCAEPGAPGRSTHEQLAPTATVDDETASSMSVRSLDGA